jgi:hypothetical protein
MRVVHVLGHDGHPVGQPRPLSGRGGRRGLPSDAAEAAADSVAAASNAYIATAAPTGRTPHGQRGRFLKWREVN